VIMPGTVRENFCYGVEPQSYFTSQQNINWAATQAAIHDFIMALPQQYDTVIGEGGIGISGGQAQRIVLARALVRRPRILVLDEATSALDMESADIIRSSVRALVADPKNNVTVIMITHAIEMMQFADDVVLMERGRVTEQGTYKDLVARKDGRLMRMLDGDAPT
jgi:ATP-binding cassette, subfamily B (MDR/TAP), member 1